MSADPVTPEAAIAPEGDHQGVTYVHQQRVSTRFSIPKAAVVFLAAALLAMTSLVPALVIVPAMKAGIRSDTQAFDLITDIAIATAIPVTMLLFWVFFRRPPGHLMSITGRTRWRFLVRAILLGAVVALGFSTIQWLLNGAPIGPRPASLLLVIVSVLITTPLQCAGEEYQYRAAIMQSVGAMFSKPIIGAVVATVVSAALFVQAHQPPDFSIVLTFVLVSIAACYLVWRTGGLEASIALHCANNMSNRTGVALFGEDPASLAANVAHDTGAVYLDLLRAALVFGVILLYARRTGLIRGGWLTPATMTTLPRPRS